MKQNYTKLLNKSMAFLSGNLTVEASLLFPMILWLIILLISTAFFLYNRCLLAQDAYSISYRGSVFTSWSESYGEVIYGNLDNRDKLRIQDNMENRITGLKEKVYISGIYVGKYPFFMWGEARIIIEEPNSRQSSGYEISLIIRGKARFSIVSKKEIVAVVRVSAVNPITVIRKTRRNGYGN